MIFSLYTVIISILSSSLFTVILSSTVLEPLKERRKYIFDEKKKVYESLIVFAQIVLFPQEARFSLKVERYDLNTLTDEECITNALNDLKMAIPKLKMITKNHKVIIAIHNFINVPDESSFNSLVNVLQRDLYK